MRYLSRLCLFCLVLSWTLLGDAGADAEKGPGSLEKLEVFITEYHRKPQPDAVPAMLKLAFEANVPEAAKKIRTLMAHSFGHMGRSQKKLVRFYEETLAKSDKQAEHAFLLQVLMICGEDQTLKSLKQLEERAPEENRASIADARKFIADPKRKLPRDKPAQTADDLDLLWSDFLVSGEYTPVSRILDTLDGADQIRPKLEAWLKKDSKKKKEVLEALQMLGMIRPKSETELVDGDLTLAFIHDAKGRYNEEGLVAGIQISLGVLKMPEENNDLVLRGAASWSLQSNLKQHPRLAELLKERYKERPTKSQKLVKQWLRLDPPQPLDDVSRRLQGTWQVVQWEEDDPKEDPKTREAMNKYVRWKFNGDELTITKAFTVTHTITTEDGKSTTTTKVKGPGGELVGDYRIETDKAETKLTWKSSGSPEFGCLIQFKDDTLVICASKEDGVPKTFSAAKGSKQILITLKKIKE